MRVVKISDREVVEFTLSEYKNIAYALAAAVSTNFLSACQKKNLLAIYNTLIGYNYNLYVETFGIFLDTLETLQIVLPAYKMNEKNPSWGQRYVIPAKNSMNDEHEKKMKIRHKRILRYWEEALGKYNLSEEEVKMKLTPDANTIQKLEDENRRLSNVVLDLVSQMNAMREEMNVIKSNIDTFNDALEPLHIKDLPRTYPGNQDSNNVIRLAVNSENSS